MGSAILHGVLNMPIDVWGDDYVDKVQRAARYIEASKLIDKLESENADLRAQLAELLKGSESLDCVLLRLEQSFFEKNNTTFAERIDMKGGE